MPMISIIFVSLGIFLCFFGLLGFAVVIYFGFQIRKRTNMDLKGKTKTTFKQLIIVNYLALCLSAFGLIILVSGMFLS